MPMLQRELFGFGVVLLLAATISASAKADVPIEKVAVTFDILDTQTIHQTITFSFAEPFFEPSLEYTSNEPITNVLVAPNNGTVSYNVTNLNGSYILTITPHTPLTKLIISFDIHQTIYRSNDIYHFFTELSFEKNARMDVHALLPQGYGISKQLYLPKQGTLGSDGKRISIDWNNLTTDEPVFFSIKFTPLNSSFNAWIIVAIVLAAIITGVSIFSYHKINKEFLKGFRPDEQKAIVYVQTHEPALQKDLEKEFGFSRAKATRIVKRLEEKQLVKKEPWGRTNRLSWIK